MPGRPAVNYSAVPIDNEIVSLTSPAFPSASLPWAEDRRSDARDAVKKFLINLKEKLPMRSVDALKAALAEKHEKWLYFEERRKDKSINLVRVRGKGQATDFWLCLRGQKPEDPPRMPKQNQRPSLNQPLTDRQRLVLETMLEMELTSEASKQTHQAIVNRINRQHDANNYKRDFAALNKRQLTCSIVGRDGGVWLTSTGIAEAEPK